MPWKLVRLRILTLLRLVLTPSVTLKINQHVGFALMAEFTIYIYKAANTSQQQLPRCLKATLC